MPVSADGKYYYEDIPARLADNIESGYADFYTWNYAISNFDSIIEDAYQKRISAKRKMNNSRLQMQWNIG